MKNSKNDCVQDCIDLADSMSTQGCGIIALGELMIAADPALIEGETLHGIGHLLTVYGRAILDDSDTGSLAARSTLAAANKTKQARSV